MSLLKSINKTAGRMATMDRYSQTRLINPESVLEHTGYVCLCSLLIAGELNKVGEDIDIAGVMSKAALHDIEEVITGDISCPTKYSNPKILEEIRIVEQDAARKVCGEIDESHFLYQIWEQSKTGKTGLIVALADKLAVVYKVQQETQYFGNVTLAEDIDGLVPALDRLASEILESGLFGDYGMGVISEIMNEAIEICQKMKK